MGKKYGILQYESTRGPVGCMALEAKRILAQPSRCTISAKNTGTSWSSSSMMSDVLASPTSKLLLLPWTSGSVR